MQQSAITNKMGNSDMSVKGLGVAGIPLPPSEDIDKVTASVNAAKQALDDMLIKSASSYSQGWKSVFDIERIQMFNQMLTQGVRNMVSTLAEGLGEMAANAESGSQVFAALLNGVAGMIQQLGELAIATGIGIAAIDESLTSLNPAVALAAGIALVALAGAVRGAAKNIGSHSGSGTGISSSRSIGTNISRSSVSSQPMVYGAVQLKGQDLWVVLSNYQTNNKFTKLG
jgi:hypothetical protein